MTMFVFRGEVFVGTPDPFDATDANADKTVIANAMRSLGNVSSFSLAPSTEQVKVTDWRSPTDATAEAWSRTMGATLSMTAEQANPDNLALNLAGRLIKVQAESVTAAKIAYKDPTTKKWTELDDTTALKANFGYYFVKSIADDGLSYQKYDLIDPDTFVLTDSSATPKTLTVDTDYTIDGVTGKLLLKGTASHGINLTGLTYPLQADFDQGLFIDTLPTPFVANKPYALSQKNISGVSLIDSSATPKVISDAYYSVDTDYGMITITNKASILAVSGLTLPLKVKGTRGVVTVMGILSENSIEKKVVLNGFNARTMQKLAVTLYKVQYTPQETSFFEKDYTKVPLKGEVMADPTKPVDDELGQYGKIEYL